MKKDQFRIALVRKLTEYKRTAADTTAGVGLLPAQSDAELSASVTKNILSLYDKHHL